MYITSRRRTVQLGLLQGLYERFLIRSLIRYSPPTQAGLYRDGLLQYYFLHSQAGELGHLMQYMHQYNAESPKQGRKRFNYIVKTIYFSYLPITYLSMLQTHQIYKTIFQFFPLSKGHVLDQRYFIIMFASHALCTVGWCEITLFAELQFAAVRGTVVNNI